MFSEVGMSSMRCFPKTQSRPKKQSGVELPFFRLKLLSKNSKQAKEAIRSRTAIFSTEAEWPMVQASWPAVGHSVQLPVTNGHFPGGWGGWRWTWDDSGHTHLWNISKTTSSGILLSFLHCIWLIPLQTKRCFLTRQRQRHVLWSRNVIHEMLSKNSKQAKEAIRSRTAIFSTEAAFQKLKAGQRSNQESNCHFFDWSWMAYGTSQLASRRSLCATSSD